MKNDFDRKLQEIIHQLIRQYHPEKIILFGSSAQGKRGQWSDLDIVLIKKTSQRFYDRIGEVSGLVKHTLPLDFLVYTPEEFSRMVKESYFIKHEVLEKGKVLYG